ncbi:MAG: nucleotidyltransferase domain-containing protein [Candidatus Eremiobacteraeota bacterium]|nr:nucleotidyltransferase domain-containing protein [Candidatus Eremiobacteraeota bacterium]
MRETDRKLLLELKRRLVSETPAAVRELIAFGSRARGDADEDSDLDVLLLLDERSPAHEKTLEDCTYQLMWDNDFKPIISLKICSISQFQVALEKEFSFYRNVKKEGIAI